MLKDKKCEQMVTACHVCRKVPTSGVIKRCGGCKVASYCSRECQQADWEKHKPLCTPIEILAEFDSGTKYGTKYKSKFRELVMKSGITDFDNTYFVMPIVNYRQPPVFIIPVKFTDRPSQIDSITKGIYRDDYVGRFRFKMNFLDRQHRMIVDTCINFGHGIHLTICSGVVGGSTRLDMMSFTEERPKVKSETNVEPATTEEDVENCTDAMNELDIEGVD